MTLNQQIAGTGWIKLTDLTNGYIKEMTDEEAMAQRATLQVLDNHTNQDAQENRCLYAMAKVLPPNEVGGQEFAGLELLGLGNND